MFTVEALVVGLALKYSSFGRLSLLVFLFWVFLGVPSSLLFYAAVWDFPIESSYAIVFKQALNAVLNAMFASVLITVSLLFKKKFTSRDRKRNGISYSSVLQSVFSLLFLLPIVGFAFHDLKQNFQGLVGENVAEAEAEGLHMATEISTQIALATSRWGANLTSFGTESDLAKIDAYLTSTGSKDPATIFRMTRSGEVMQVYGPETPFLKEALGESYVYRDSGLRLGLVDGCIGEYFISHFLTGGNNAPFIFAWRLDTVNFHQLETGNLQLTCSSETSKPRPEEFQVAASATLIRDEASSTKSLLRTWLESSIIVSSELNAVWSTQLNIVQAMDLKILDMQRNTALVLGRLFFFAGLIVFGGAILDVFFRMWVQKFGLVAEGYLKNRTLLPGHVNDHFREDRVIRTWLRRFTTAIEAEENRKFIAQNNFDTLVKAATIPIFAVNKEGILCQWNPAMSDLTGYRYDEVIGKHAKDVAIDINAAVSNKSKGKPFHVELIDRCGRSMPILASQLLLGATEQDKKTVPETEPSEIRYFVGQNLREVKESQAKLIHASRLAALGEMASSYAHELNQPLNIISLSAGNLLERAEGQDTLPPTYVAAKAQRIEEQALRAGEIIQRIRAFVLKSGDEELTIFDPVKHIQLALNILAEQYHLNCIQVAITEPSEKILVLGQTLLFEQVIVNILNNAQQALLDNPHDNRRVDVTFSVGASSVKILIQDNGQGIPEALRSRIFEPFVTTKGADSGTGVGLYMCRSVIEAMQGEIKAIDNGLGACIEIRLPRRYGEVISD